MEQEITFLQIYSVTALGIVISIALPILKQFVPKGGSEEGEEGIWLKLKPYVMAGLFSLATALLIVAFSGDALKDWQTALLAGYAWDSTIQKVGT